MDISIVIVNYNTSRLLDECISSIKRETSCQYEIFVVDNASQDDSVEMLHRKHPEVNLIENDRNVGFARANNQGFKRACGKYFFMLNPDTLILDGAIDKLFEYMEHHPQAGVCGPKNLDPDMNLQYNCDHYPSLWNDFVQYTRLDAAFPHIRLFNLSRMRYWNYSELQAVDRIVGCSLLIRSDIFKKVGGLDDNYFMYFEETDLCYRIGRMGYKIIYYPNAAIIHYGGESSKSSEEVFNKTAMNYFLPSKYYFHKKNYGIINMIEVRLVDLCYGILLWLKNYKRKDVSIRTDRLAKAEMLIKNSLNVNKYHS